MSKFYKLNIMPTNKILEKVNNYFSDIQINRGNYDLDIIITTYVLVTFNNGTVFSISADTPNKYRRYMLDYLNNNHIEYIYFYSDDKLYSNVKFSYNRKHIPDSYYIYLQFKHMRKRLGLKPHNKFM